MNGALPEALFRLAEAGVFLLQAMGVLLVLGGIAALAVLFFAVRHLIRLRRMVKQSRRMAGLRLRETPPRRFKL